VAGAKRRSPSADGRGGGFAASSSPEFFRQASRGILREIPALPALREAERGATDQVRGGRTPSRQAKTRPFGMHRPHLHRSRVNVRHEPDHPEAGSRMPKKPNYNFEKRQKELVRKQKQEDKRARKRQEEQRPDATPESVPEAPPPATE
jgi:hypothetical protein